MVERTNLEYLELGVDCFKAGSKKIFNADGQWKDVRLFKGIRPTSPLVPKIPQSVIPKSLRTCEDAEFSPWSCGEDMNVHPRAHTLNTQSQRTYQIPEIRCPLMSSTSIHGNLHTINHVGGKEDLQPICMTHKLHMALATLTSLLPCLLCYFTASSLSPTLV